MKKPVPHSNPAIRVSLGAISTCQWKWSSVGVLSGALWSDLDGDGYCELILACEWGPIRIFKNEHGKLVPWDAPVTINGQPSTINQITGWWNGVTSGDFDGDGRLDLVASNWGLNSSYRPSQDHPVRIYYSDFGGHSGMDIIEALYDRATQREVPARGYAVVVAALPWITERFPTFESYGRAAVSEIYAEKLKTSRHLEVSTLASMVFFNRGDRFEAKRLPPEAQFAPAFAAAAADFDGDGNEDLFLSQNFYPTHPETPRLDAGRSLWLRGDGKGGLRAVPGQISGVMVYGDQRGAAICDYDGDGRVDLVVTQNGAATRLYHNLGAIPGLRVRLRGPPGNPTGIGAVIQIDYGDHLGPAREIHAGSGYWSQDSAVTVIARAARPAKLRVRWPGGKTTSAEIPAEAREISCDSEGMIKKTR